MGFKALGRSFVLTSALQDLFSLDWWLVEKKGTHHIQILWGLYRDHIP